jgi:hypothetical protein
MIDCRVCATAGAPGCSHPSRMVEVWGPGAKTRRAGPAHNALANCACFLKRAHVIFVWPLASLRAAEMPVKNEAVWGAASSP